MLAFTLTPRAISRPHIFLSRLCFSEKFGDCTSRGPKLIRCFVLPQTMPPSSSSSSSSKIVAEYAKSNRSSCKKCSKTIAAKTLRLGLVTRDARGFDMTKWHHLDCFPVSSEAMDAVEKISGFSSLENDDQAALKELVEQCGKNSEVATQENDGNTEETKGTNKRKDSRVGKKDDENEQAESDERSTKMKKSSSPQISAPLDLSFSLSDIKDKYRDAKLLPKWKAFQTVIFLERDEGLKDSEKIAAFDFDGCLANTNVRISGENAWSLMHASIPEKLQSLYDQGYKLVIFTNESNIDRWKNKRQVAVDSKVGRLNNFINLVKVPIQVFIACGVATANGKEDPFRKPKTGMWQIMKELFNSGIAIDMDQSFYVGDAAGRPNDHSDADIKFAQALGLKFHVPEEYF